MSSFLIKYRLAICYRELNDSNLAISILQSIPSKSRLPKINMLLAKLQHRQSRNPLEAIASYKDVLRANGHVGYKFTLGSRRRWN